MRAKCNTLPAIFRVTRAFSGSLVKTSIFFLRILPPYPLVLTLMLMVPSPPAGICLG
jgi:hypothetical protein